MPHANADIMLLVAKVEDQLAMVHDTAKKLRAFCKPELQVDHDTLGPTPKQIVPLLTADALKYGRWEPSPLDTLRSSINVEMILPEFKLKLSEALDAVKRSMCIDWEDATSLQEAEGELKTLRRDPRGTDFSLAIKAYNKINHIIEHANRQDLSTNLDCTRLHRSMNDVVCLILCREVSPFEKQAFNAWVKDRVDVDVALSKIGNSRWQIFVGQYLP